MNSLLQKLLIGFVTQRITQCFSTICGQQKCFAITQVTAVLWRLFFVQTFSLPGVNSLLQKPLNLACHATNHTMLLNNMIGQQKCFVITEVKVVKKITVWNVGHTVNIIRIQVYIVTYLGPLNHCCGLHYHSLFGKMSLYWAYSPPRSSLSRITFASTHLYTWVRRGSGSKSVFL